jgi:hypothetical protein
MKRDYTNEFTKMGKRKYKDQLACGTIPELTVAGQQEYLANDGGARIDFDLANGAELDMEFRLGRISYSEYLRLFDENKCAERGWTILSN